MGTEDNQANRTEGKTSPELVQRAGDRIRALRKGRGWTMQDLAARADVSRRMLTQMELGQANPSLGTLDRVAKALSIDFVELVSADPDSDAEAVAVWEGARDSKAVLLGSTPAPRAELWKWTLGPGVRYEAQPDRSGAHELHHVLAGVLSLETIHGVQAVPAGGTALIASDAPYAYFNGEDVSTVFIRLVTGA